MPYDTKRVCSSRPKSAESFLCHVNFVVTLAALALELYLFSEPIARTESVFEVAISVEMKAHCLRMVVDLLIAVAADHKSLSYILS